jgi:hypothetical protein
MLNLEQINIESNHFLKDIEHIQLFYIYIDENNNIYSVKRSEEKIENNSFSKERQLYIIKERQFNLTNKHKLISICYFNMNIEQNQIHNTINNKLENTFFHILNILDTINFKKTAQFLHNQNNVFYIFKYLTNAPHNTTKRVVLIDNKKTTRKNKFVTSKNSI